MHCTTWCCKHCEQLGIVHRGAPTRCVAQVPITINCWPTPSGSETYLNIEYESSATYDLQRVVISVPGVNFDDCACSTRSSEFRQQCYAYAASGSTAVACVRMRLSQVYILKCMNLSGNLVVDNGKEFCMHAHVHVLSNRSVWLAGVYSAPKVNSCDGEWRVDKNQNCLLWTIDLIDDSNRSGSMEVVVDSASPDSFFPCTVSFVAKATLCDITVPQCTSTQTQAPVRFGLSKELTVSTFEILH